MTWYKTGTVNATQGSNAILGTGTAFISNSRVGDAFRGPDGEWYEVINIASDTAMSISPVYQGASTVSDDYSVAPMQGYVKDTADALRAASLVIGSSATDMSAQLEVGKGYAERSEAAATTVTAAESVVQTLAAQVSADTTTTTNNTVIAQNSATAANAVSGRFLLPKTSLPTLRDNGEPLEVGDRVLLSTTGDEWIYKSSGWAVNNLDGQQISGEGGASFVNGAMQYADNYAAIRALPFSKIKAVTALGCRFLNDGGGGGIFYPDPSDTTSVDNGGSILVTADGGRLKLVQDTPHRLSQFSAVCDGVSNDSAQMQKLLDANKGKKVIVDKGAPMIAGVSLIGTEYDHTFISCEGGELKLAPDSGSTFGGAWIGILVKDCNFVKVNAKWNGNRAAMTIREQIFCVATAGAQDFQSDWLTFREIMGDGLYVAQSDWFTASNPSRRMNIGKVYGYNTTDSGRNTVSIISVSGFTLGEITSYQVGGLMNGIWQPGGIDIEPDQGYHVCEDIAIGTAHVTTAGSSGIAVLGKAYTSDEVGDWNTQRVTIGSFNLVITRAGSGGMSCTRWFDLSFNGQVTYAPGVRGTGLSIAAGSRLQGSVKTKGCTFGARIGSGIGLNDFELNLVSNDYSVCGMRTSIMSRGTIKGRCSGSPSGSTSFAIECHNEGVVGATQTNVVYEVDAPYDNVAARAFRNDPDNPMLFSGTYVRDCDWSGYSSPSVTNDAPIFCENVRGWTDQSGMPENGMWVVGMFVRNRNPSIVAGRILIGWARLTTGGYGNNVLNIDWAAVYTTTV